MRFSSILVVALLAVAVSAQLHASLRAENTRVWFTVTNPTNVPVTVLYVAVFDTVGHPSPRAAHGLVV